MFFLLCNKMPPKKPATPATRRAAAATSSCRRAPSEAYNAFVQGMAATVLSPHARFDKHPSLRKAAVMTPQPAQKPGGVKTGA